MRVVMPTGTASAQIIQTQIMPQAMLKQGTVVISKLAAMFHTKQRLLNPVSYASCGFFSSNIRNDFSKQQQKRRQQQRQPLQQHYDDLKNENNVKNLTQIIHKQNTTKLNAESSYL